MERTSGLSCDIGLIVLVAPGLECIVSLGTFVSPAIMDFVEREQLTAWEHGESRLSGIFGHLSPFWRRH